ncbi:MAG TPA: hypothetical protein VII56_08300 [Rhizomicrobium sp.]
MTEPKGLYSPTASLLALRTVVHAIEVEIAACIAAGVRMPRCRQEELADALLPVAAEAQRYALELPAAEQLLVAEARARMVAALARRELPTAASRPTRAKPCAR